MLRNVVMKSLQLLLLVRVCHAFGPDAVAKDVADVKVLSGADGVLMSRQVWDVSGAKGIVRLKVRPSSLGSHATFRYFEIPYVMNWTSQPRRLSPWPVKVLEGVHLNDQVPLTQQSHE